LKGKERAVTDPKISREMEHASDPTSPALVSLGAVSLDRGASARSALTLPAGLRRSEEVDARVVDARTPHRVALRFKLIVGAAVTGCVVILVLAAVQTARSGSAASSGASTNSAALMAPAAVAPPVTSPSTPSTPASSPAMTVAAHVMPMPAATHVDPSDKRHAETNRATIRLARAGQTLTVDGKRTGAASVVVACGAHTVAVGTEKPRHIDAPCGRTVIVDVGKTTLAKSDGAKLDGKAHVAPRTKR
jgi:hypothetical protein